MKKIIGLIVIILIVIGLFWAAGENEQGNPIKLGVIIPLTGAQAKAGEDIRAALEIAKNDLGNEVELIYEDDGFSPERAVSAFNKLVTVDQVDAIIGPLNGSAVEGIKPLANQNEIIAYSPWGSSNKIEGYFIKGSHEADREARALAELIVTKLDKKKPAVIYMNNDYGLLNYRSFKDEVESRGGVLAGAEPFLIGSQDFRTSLLKLKNTNPDALFIVYNGAGVGLIAKQAREIGVNIPLFGAYATEASDLIAAGGDSLEGLIYTFPINEGSLTEKQQKFISDFQKSTTGRPQVAAYNAYDIYSILTRALNECEGKNASCARDSILSLKNYQGVSGNISFDQNSIQRDFYFKTVKDGQFVKMEE